MIFFKILVRSTTSSNTHNLGYTTFGKNDVGMIGESAAVSSDIASKTSTAEMRPHLRKLLSFPFPGSKGNLPKSKNGVRS